MLEEVLGSRNKIKLLRQLIKSRDWQFNLSQIAKASGVDKGSVSKIIAELEKSRIIETRRSGKLLLFRMNAQHHEVISKIFELEKRWSR